MRQSISLSALAKFKHELFDHCSQLGEMDSISEQQFLSQQPI